MDEITVEGPPDDASPGVRALFTMWNKARAGRHMPARADIDPEAIGAELLPYVMIADFESNPFRVRYRLVGTKIVESARRDFTGRYLDQLEWPLVQAAIPIYRKVWETGRPAFGSFGAELTLGGWYRIGYAILPLSANRAKPEGCRGAAEKCLVVVDYLGLDMTTLERRSTAAVKPFPQ